MDDPESWGIHQLANEMLWGQRSALRVCNICVICVCTQLCPTLWHSLGCGPPGSSVHGTSLARVLKWAAISFSRGSSWMRDWFLISCISCMVLCLVTLCDPIDHRPLGFSVHGNSPGKTTGVGCHDLHQGILASQGLNTGLWHCRQILYHSVTWDAPSTFVRTLQLKLRVEHKLSLVKEQLFHVKKLSCVTKQVGAILVWQKSQSQPKP